LAFSPTYCTSTGLPTSTSNFPVSLRHPVVIVTAVVAVIVVVIAATVVVLVVAVEEVVVVATAVHLALA
jgi:hypothetical protein